MEFKIYEYPLIIKEAHLDTFGHVNNATYLQIYEEARWELITNNGYGLKEIKNSGMGPVILDIHIKFIKELRLRERIIIHSQTNNQTGKIGTIKQWITNSKGEICSEILLTIGLFDTSKRKLIDPTPEWLAAIK